MLRRTSNTRQPVLLLACLFLLAPLIDAMTGIALLTGRIAEGSAGSASQGLRAVILLLALAYVGGRGRLAVLGLLGWMLALETLWLMLHQSPIGAVVGFTYSAKLAYLLAITLVVRRLLLASPTALMKWYTLGVFLYASLTAVPTALGLHFSSYDEGSFGSKGWFASGNGLGTFLAVSTLLLLSVGRQHLSRRLVALLSFVASLLVATKAVALIAIAALAQALCRLRLPTAFLVATLLAGLAYGAAQWAGDLLALVFEVALFRLEQTDSLAEFFSSGRIGYVVDAFAQVDLSGPLGLLRTLVGAGPYLSFRNANDALIEYDTLETDLFDLFFAYGLLGVAVYLGGAVWVGARLIRARSWGVALAWVAVVGQSVLAGHVLYNGMVATCVAMIVGFATLPALRRNAYAQESRTSQRVIGATPA